LKISFEINGQADRLFQGELALLALATPRPAGVALR